MKKYFMLLMLLLLIPIVFSIAECKPIALPSDITPNCTITSTWNYTAPCSQWMMMVYNGTGNNTANFTYQSYGITGRCYAVWNISAIGSYNYIVTNGDGGNILIEGEKEMMNFTVIFFLMLFNIGLFLVPLVIRKFTDSKAGDYMVRHLFWIAGVIFLWFNLTILRVMADGAGLGIDSMLLGYWWIFTVLASSLIFVLVYVMTKGAIKLSQEAEKALRMGMPKDE